LNQLLTYVHHFPPLSLQFLVFSPLQYNSQKPERNVLGTQNIWGAICASPSYASNRAPDKCTRTHKCTCSRLKLAGVGRGSQIVFRPFKDVAKINRPADVQQVPDEPKHTATASILWSYLGTVDSSLQNNSHCCAKQMRSHRNNTTVWAVHC